MINGMNAAYYGSYRNKTFSDIYPSYEDFKADYDEVQYDIDMTDASIKTIYYLLYAKYGNSTITNADETQWIYRLFGIIYMYGPTWEKRMDIQKKLRNLTDEDIRTGTKIIYNHAYNPGSAPSTNTTTELEYINEQNTNKYNNSPIEAYSNLWNVLRTDITSEFINRFGKLFLTIVQPELPLYYENNDEEDNA